MIFAADPGMKAKRREERRTMALPERVLWEVARYKDLAKLCAEQAEVERTAGNPDLAVYWTGEVSWWEAQAQAEVQNELQHQALMRRARGE